MTGDSHQHREERIGAVFAFVQNADERLGFVQGGLACPVMAGTRGRSIRLGVRAGDASCGRVTRDPCPPCLHRYRWGFPAIFPMIFIGA